MSGAATPYIGSLISLVSNAGIRYEGKLFCIDTKESTVTLAHVQSFGTEDRAVEKKVAGRPDVYEYIVFRGKDIKDLTVNEAGPKQPPAAQDPAIIKSATVGSSPSLSQYSSPYQTPGVFSPFGGLPYSNYPVGYQTPQFADSRLPPMPPHVPTGIQPGLLPPHPTPPIHGAGLSRNSTPSPDLLNQSEVKTQETQTKTTTQQSTQTTKKKPTTRRSSTDKTHEKENKNPEQPNQERSEEKPRQDKRPSSENKPRGNRRGRRGGYRGPRKDSLPKEFEGDYDFQSANANFKKEEIEEELQKKLGLVSLNDEVEVEGEESAEAAAAANSVEPFYNKGSSFFDTISCEAIDREKNRKSHPSWQEERKINTETFGTSGYRRGRGGRGRGRGNYRGRGGGRGYRGRGGWRGGRGGRGSNRGGGSRDWVDYPMDADTSKLQQNLPSGGTPGSPSQAPVQA